MADDAPDTEEIAKFLETETTTATKFWKDLVETQDAPIDVVALAVK